MQIRSETNNTGNACGRTSQLYLSGKARLCCANEHPQISLTESNKVHVLPIPPSPTGCLETLCLLRDWGREKVCLGMAMWPKLWSEPEVTSTPVHWPQQVSRPPLTSEWKMQVSRPSLTSKWEMQSYHGPGRQRASYIRWAALMMATSASANISILSYLLQVFLLQRK